MAILTKDQVSRRARDFFDKGFRAMEQSNLDYAMDMFLHALEVEPGFADARKFFQAAAVRRFKMVKGSHLITSITSAVPVMIGRAKLGKKPLQALHDAEKLYRNNPYNASVVYLLADAAERLGMPEVAVQSLEILREHKGDDEAFLLKLAEAYNANEQTSQAREVYQSLSQMKPGNQNYLKLYKDATAIDTMRKGGWGQGSSYRDMMKDTKEAESLEQAQRSVKTAGDLEIMIADTLEKITREPDNVNYRRALADLYAKNNQLDEAINTLEEAQAAGADPTIDRRLSELRLNAMQKELKALEEQGDEDAVARHRQAIAEYTLTDARERVRRYPNDLEFKYDLGLLLYERGEMTEAIQQLQAAQKNPRRRISALYYLALCFKEKKQYDIAREQLDKAAQELPAMDDMKKDVLYELGSLCEAMDDAAAAVEYYKDIYAVDIGYKDIAEKIENVYKAS